MHKCIKCGEGERMELFANNDIVHYDRHGRPVHAGFFPKTRMFSFLCEECIVQYKKRGHHR